MLIVFDCLFDLGVGVFSSVIAYLYATRTNNTAFKVVVFTVFTLSGAHWPRATEKYLKKLQQDLKICGLEERRPYRCTVVDRLLP